MALLETYDGLISQCRTENDVNRVLIAFGNTLTPYEVIELEETIFVENVYELPALRPDKRFTDKQLHAWARTWIEDLRDELRRVGKSEVETFLRRDIRKSVTLYSDGSSAQGKTLLVTLPGANHRMMMPISTFLQNIAAETTDVLMIRDGTRSGYREGLEGLAPAVEELGPAITNLIDLNQYARRVGIGVSAGGLPILMVALQMDFDAVLVCGGGDPADPRWKRPGYPSPAETIRTAAAKGGGRRITVAYGRESPPDRVSAQGIAACISMTPIEVSLPDKSVSHNILHPLSIRGELPAFLAEHLGI